MNNSATSLTDTAAIIVGAVGVVATLVLTLLGVLIALQFWGATKRIDNLEKMIADDRENFYGLRVLSELMFDAVSRITSIVDIHRRAIEDLICRSNPMSSAERDLYLANFERRFVIHFDEMTRISLCCQAMMTNDTEDHALEALTSHFPDYQTYLFLDALGKTRAGEVRNMIELEALGLEKSFRRNPRKAN